MSFVDKVQIAVEAGKGGDGKLSFRRDKFISRGGPDGGDGGNGGDIVLSASRNQNTLAALRYQKVLRAEHGRSGGKSKKHGKSGKDLIVSVPVGTAVLTDDGRPVCDLTVDSEQAVVAKGGRGGFGNAHFISSRRQAPNFAEKGEPGESMKLFLELKMIADVGIIGLPNAGKSTLLSKISNARPEVADYPFTTLTPNLGVVDIDKETSILFADIPGLIEGASEGKGLGHDFLRHIERTAVILHLIDVYGPDVSESYNAIRAELEAYKPELIKRPEVTVLNKIEGLDEAVINDLLGKLKKVVHNKNTKLFAISAQAGIGLKPLMFAIKDIVKEAREEKAETEDKEPAIPVLTLNDFDSAWEVRKKGKRFIVTGQKIEQFARRTDFDNEQGVQRLRDIMRREGIMHELKRQGIEPGDTISILEHGLNY